MADQMQPAAPSFEDALSELVSALVEGGASPKEAVQVAQEVAKPSPTPKRSWMPEVGAGGNGLPYMPPLPRSQTEVHSTLSPHADTFMGMTGLPTAMGPAVDTTIKLGRATGDAAAGMTMLPWAAETGAQLGETAARKGILPSSSAEAAEGPDKLQQLLEVQSVLQRQAEDARQRREIERKTGQGRNYNEADREFREASDRLGAHNELVKQEQRLQSPEHQLEMKQAREKADEEKRLREANTPWRIKNQALAQSLPNYALAASAALPATIGAARNLRTFFPGSAQGQMRNAISENALARSSGDASKAALTEAELGNLLKRQPTWKNELGEAAAAAGAGGALAAEASMFPDQWDAYNLPEGPPQARARADATNPLNYIERGVMGALTGLSGYEAGSRLTPSRGANASRAQAITDNPYKPPPPAGPPAPTPVGGGPQQGPANLPPGIKLDKNGLAYDAHTGQKIRKRLLEGRED